MGWNTSGVSSLVQMVARDVLLYSSISKFLRSRGMSVCHYASVEEFLDFEYSDIDKSCLILCVSKLDLKAPGFYDLLKTLSGRETTILITDDYDIRSAVECLKAGAADYLVRPCSHDEIMVAITAALEIDYARRAKVASAARALESFEMLTTRERMVMGLVTTGLLNKQVAWSLGITEATIKAHRAHVMSKMNVKTLPSLVRLADLIALQPDGRLSSEVESCQTSL